MSFNVIINTLTLGLIWWLIGLEQDSRREKVFGALMVLVSIILNMLSQFKII